MLGIFSFSRPSIPCGPGTETIESGGGAATPVAEGFGKFLEQLFGGGDSGGFRPPGRFSPGRTGTDRSFNIPGFTEGGTGVGNFGDPTGKTFDLMQALNDLIKGPDVTGSQEAIQKSIQQSTDLQTADLRERFTAGGGSQGTPSAVAEAIFRSQTPAKTATAVGGLELEANRQRMQALFQLFQVLLGFSGKGIPQARTDTIVNPGTFATVASLGESGARVFGASKGR